MTTTFTEPAIAVHDITFRYAREAPDVLHDVTLTVPNGGVTAILGPNGSGKTTLLHLVLGLLTPQRGEIHVAGRNRTAPDGRVPAHQGHDHRAMSRVIGLVPQDEPPAFNLNVLETVLLGRAPYLRLLQRPGDDDRARAFAALETVGIAHLWARAVPALSGGERQLVILARALAQEPAILLLDEPTAHLDVGNARRIITLIRRLRDQGQTVVFTTHDPNAAAAAADYVVLMRAGRVLHAGPSAATLTPPNLSATYDVPIEVHQDGHHPLIVVF